MSVWIIVLHVDVQLGVQTLPVHVGHMPPHPGEPASPHAPLELLLLAEAVELLEVTVLLLEATVLVLDATVLLLLVAVDVAVLAVAEALLDAFPPVALPPTCRSLSWEMIWHPPAAAVAERHPASIARAKRARILAILSVDRKARKGAAQLTKFPVAPRPA
jgi:hypothetical protein